MGEVVEGFDEEEIDLKARALDFALGGILRSLIVVCLFFCFGDVFRPLIDVHFSADVILG